MLVASTLQRCSRCSRCECRCESTAEMHRLLLTVLGSSGCSQVAAHVWRNMLRHRTLFFSGLFSGPQPCPSIEALPDSVSYRSADVVEALERMLPEANPSGESTIVFLDLFSSHLPDAVVAKFRSRAHVLFFLGGGQTHLTQMNDTYFHQPLHRAMLAAQLDEFEDMPPLI